MFEVPGDEKNHSFSLCYRWSVINSLPSCVGELKRLDEMSWKKCRNLKWESKSLDSQDTIELVNAIDSRCSKYFCEPPSVVSFLVRRITYHIGVSWAIDLAAITYAAVILMPIHLHLIRCIRRTFLS